MQLCEFTLQGQLIQIILLSITSEASLTSSLTIAATTTTTSQEWLNPLGPH